jgi:hypothetical protein
MNPSEFKAWFEGFTENLDGPPGERAWLRICERVKTIRDAPPVERHHFYDHYARPWLTYPQYVPRYGTLVANGVGVAAAQGVNGDPQPTHLVGGNALTFQNKGSAQVFNSSEAFTELGRVEAASWSAPA